MFALIANAESPNVRLKMANSKLAKTNMVLRNALRELAVEQKVGREQKVGGNCDSGCEKYKAEWLGDGVCDMDSCGGCSSYTTNGVFDGGDCAGTKSEQKVGFGGPRDCDNVNFDSSCVGCRGEEETCCTDSNCGLNQFCELSMDLDWKCTPVRHTGAEEAGQLVEQIPIEELPDSFWTETVIQGLALIGFASAVAYTIQKCRSYKKDYVDIENEI